MLDDKFESDTTFLDKCSYNPEKLSAQDVALICRSLELAGAEGMTLDVFAARLRLLESDVMKLIEAHPEVGKSIQIARARRKEFLHTNLVQTAHRSPHAAKELLTNPLLSQDLLQKVEEKDAKKSLETVVEESLLARGIKPKGFSQIVYLTGRAKEMDAPPDPEEGLSELSGFLPASKVAEMLQAKA